MRRLTHAALLVQVATQLIPCTGFVRSYRYSVDRVANSPLFLYIYTTQSLMNYAQAGKQKQKKTRVDKKIMQLALPRVRAASLKQPHEVHVNDPI